MIINGEKIEEREKSKVINPYSKEVVGEISIAREEDIIKAIDLCYNFKKNLLPDQRAQILQTAAEKIILQKQEIAKIITSESGLSLKDTLHEVERVHNTLAAAAKAIPKIEEDKTQRYIDGDNENPRLRVISEPLDLIVAITPFNHPMNQVAHKIAPAIAAGTSVVLKPPEKTPLSAIKLVEILHESGLPKNMINLITTDNSEKFLEIVLLTKKPQLISFTGGVEVGKKIARKIAETGNELIKYVPELGGNSAFIVLEDADIKLAVERAMNAYANSGQRCTSIKRILVHNLIADEFIEEFLKLTKELKYGDPFDPETDVGTVINEDAAKLIQSRVNDAIEQGAELLYGNKREGALYSPTLLDNVNPKSELVVKETFGPVAPIIRINNIQGAIEIINSINYKLAGAVMTKNKENAELISNSIKVGQFNWNHNPGYRTEQAPFGGFGDSGNGEKEGVISATEGMRRIRTFYEH